MTTVDSPQLSVIDGHHPAPGGRSVISPLDGVPPYLRAASFHDFTVPPQLVKTARTAWFSSTISCSAPRGASGVVGAAGTVGAVAPAPASPGFAVSVGAARF